MSTKSKHDDKPKRKPAEVTRPDACLVCRHDQLEGVIASRQASTLIRIADLPERGLGRLLYQRLPGLNRRHLIYGWRCENCGFLMWFTAKRLE